MVGTIDRWMAGWIAGCSGAHSVSVDAVARRYVWRACGDVIVVGHPRFGSVQLRLCVDLPIARVANISQAIRTLKKARVWVTGAALGLETTALGQTDFTRDLAIVIGAEGEGLAPLVARECDYLV